MSTLPEHRSESVFSDFKAAYSPTQALVEAHRCLYCHDAPCTQVCPTHIDIPQFIRKISTGNVEGAARTIFASNIFGMGCARVCPVEVLCVGDCVHNRAGVPPVQIGKLQRFATDAAFSSGWRFAKAGAPTGKHVALIGGGPASLACAHELRRLGHAVTLYEKRELLGGLHVWGVAPYKIRADRAAEEVSWVLAIGGIEVHTGVTVAPDGDITPDQLLAQHDAVFIGMGLGADRYVPGGEELSGVLGGVEWIEQMKLGQVDLSAVQHAVVLGGGNTALDCVRELQGLGVDDVAMAYRGGSDQASGYLHELAPARVAGLRCLWNTQPLGFAATNGKVTAVQCVHTDANKRPIAGSEHTLPADLVLIAIGQAKLGDLFGHLQGISIHNGRITVDARGFTGHPCVYAGGDCVSGGKEVVNAVAEGRDAARAIHEDLTGDTLPPLPPINHITQG